MSGHEPYTYVTLTLQPNKPARLNVSFHTTDLQVFAGLIDETRPYLDVSSKEACVSVSTTGVVTAEDVNTAREIFNAAARYLAECERLHTEQSAA